MNIRVYGRVQMVGFRYSAKEVADQLHIFGFAKNLTDGSVYIEAEGKEENLKKFLTWCKKGPFLAKVDRAEVKEGKLKNFSEFRVT